MDSGKVIISFKKGKKTIVFIDSLNWFKTSLKNLGDSIGIEKLEMPDFKKSWDSQEWIDYNKNDVVILKQYFLNYLKWLRTNDMGNFGYTIASQSFNTFRHKFMHQQIYIHDNADAIRLERESYHGARTECFKIGKFYEDIFYLDVNSMYPTVMKYEKYPIRLIGELKTQNLKKLEQKLKQYCIIANVKIKTDEPVFSVKQNGKLIFPVGSFDVTLTTNELVYALKHDFIEKINFGYVYEAGYIFEEFVDYIYDKRKIAKQENNNLDANFLKLILNSLYGKFGQQIAIFSEIDNNEEIEQGSGYYVNTETGQKKKIKYINNQFFVEKEKEESYNSFCAIASHVTANSRLLLWKYIKQAGLDSIYYCDTDSLFVNKTGYDKLLPECNDMDLGKLKLEEKSNYLEIRGLKDYVIGDKERLKGINIKNSVKVSANEYAITIWPKIRSMINRKTLTEYYTMNSRKILKRNYDKGNLKSNGNVEPIELNYS